MSDPGEVKGLRRLQTVADDSSVRGISNEEARVASAERGLVEAVRLIEASKHAEALDLLNSIERTFSTAGRPDRIRAARQRRFMIYQLIGRAEEAVAGNRQLVEDYLAAGEELAAAKVRCNLGYDLHQVGDRSGAAAQYRRAARTFRASVGQEYNLATCYMNLGSTLLSSRNRASKAYLMAARDLFEAVSNEVKASDCRLLLARHADIEGEFVAADRLRRDAEVTYEANGDIVRAAHVEYLRGSSAARRNDFDTSSVFLRAALKAFLTSGAPSHLELADCARRLAVAHRHRGELDRAWGFSRLAVVVLNQVRTGLREPRLRASLKSQRGSVYTLALELAIELGHHEDAAVIIETARAQQAPSALGQPDGSEIYVWSGESSAARDTASEFATVGLLRSAPLPMFSVRGRNALDPPETVRDVVQELDLDSSAVSMVISSTPVTCDLDRVRREVAGDLGMWWSSCVVDDQLFWVSLDPTGPMAGRVAFHEGSALRKALGVVLGGLPDEGDPGLAAFKSQLKDWDAHGLYDEALSEMVVALPPGLCTRVLSDAQQPQKVAHAPAAELARIPFGLIPTSYLGPRLLEVAAVICCPSPALVSSHDLWSAAPEGKDVGLRDAETGQLVQVALAVVDPSGDLPRTRKLARLAIRAIGTQTPRPFGSKRIAPATRSNLSEMLNRGHVDRAHGVALFACHSTAGDDDDPLAASLQLADGPLTARELITVESQSEFPLPRRVMFASCSSAGLARPDWAGLTAAASWLGARVAIASLWPLTSGSAAVKLDESVLAALRQPDPAEALRRVQAEQLAAWRRPSRWTGPSQRTRCDPRIWSAYTILAL